MTIVQKTMAILEQKNNTYPITIYKKCKLGFTKQQLPGIYLLLQNPFTEFLKKMLMQLEVLWTEWKFN